MQKVSDGMVNYLVTDFGMMRVPNDIVIPHEALEKEAFDKWYLHQSRRAHHAWRVGRALPKANDGGW